VVNWSTSQVVLAESHDSLISVVRRFGFTLPTDWLLKKFIGKPVDQNALRKYAAR